MSKNYQKYPIDFGILKENNSIKDKDNIPEKEVEISDSFEFNDYSSDSTFKYLKEYFLTNFSHKVQCCICEISIFIKSENTYRKLKSSEEAKLKDSTLPDKIFLIKVKEKCNCEYKLYKDYMTKSKIEVLKQLQKATDTKKKLLEEKDEQMSENEILKNKISKLENENKELKSKEQQTENDLKEEIEKYKKEIENLEKTIYKLEEENKKLNKTDELKYHLNPTFEDFYDIIIDINSIKKVNREGWKVKFNEKGLEKYNKYKEKELITIGVLGNNNKGKSFLLSKISKIKLLSGTSIHTEGLSVKYPELKGYKGRQIILLDSAGFETPVLKKENNTKGRDDENINEESKEKSEKLDEKETEKENSKEKLDDEDLERNKEFKENAKDKIMTELFLENLIIKVSDIILVVVGKLTYSEQLLINKIKVECKRQNKLRIFIIHNLQEFRMVKQVEDYIENYLLKFSTFDLKKRSWITTKRDKEIMDEQKENDNSDIKDNMNEENLKGQLNNIHFTEIIKYDDKKLEIYHLIIANEDSEAGKVYNKYAYDFIENIYNLIPEPKEFDVFNQVKDNFMRLSNTFLDNTIEGDKFNEDEKIIQDKIIKLNSKKELSLKKCYTDELSFSFFKTSKFEPKYNYFKPDPNTLEIRFEIPGNVNIQINHEIVGDETIIKIKGIKHKDKKPEKQKDNLFNIREFGEFELNIPLKVEDFKINNPKPKEGYPKIVNGVCIIQYELASNGEGGSASVDEL